MTALMVVMLSLMIAHNISILLFSKEYRGLHGALLMVNIHSLLGGIGIHF